MNYWERVRIARAQKWLSIKDVYRDPTIRTLVAASREETPFNFDHFTIGPGCGDGAVLDPHSFLMKGEELSPPARWRANPAAEFRDHHGFAGASTVANVRARG